LLEAQVLLGGLSESEFDFWTKGGIPKRIDAGETVVGYGDFSDLFLVLEGSFAVSEDISPSIVGLDSFLTGLLSNREWITDTKMVIWKIDSGRLGQSILDDADRFKRLHFSTLQVLALMVRRQRNKNSELVLPRSLALNMQKGINRFFVLRKKAGLD